MSTYAIGDIQGCFSDLKALLQTISFDANKDILWFTGDLVNRGPESLETLRFIKNLGNQHIVVLGNHDLHLLSLYYAKHKQNSKDTLQAVLNAEDAPALMAWLCQRPLLHVDRKLNYSMVHAGLAPSWSLAKAEMLTAEVEAELRSDNRTYLLANIYGDTPDDWQDDLSGLDRFRAILNYCTRVRLCDSKGRIDFTHKGTLQDKPEHLIPWYELPDRVTRDERIIFGHWSALLGVASCTTVFPLDTGCVWGGHLTAMRLEDGKRFCVKCNCAQIEEF